MAERLGADVAVVGAGPAGIAAACRAAEAGRRVVVLDEGGAPGGQIWRHGGASRPPRAARAWLARLAASGARLLADATVVEAVPGRLLAERAGEPIHVSAPRLVLATGARERFLPFPGWTLPGVLGVGGAKALLEAGASFAGQAVVVAGSGPLLLPVAASLARAGARVSLVAEQASLPSVAGFAASLWREPGKLLQAARYRAAFAPAAYRTGAWVSEAIGGERVAEAVLTDGVRSWQEPCDVLCSAFGLVPNVELPRLLGCELEGGFVRVDGRQQTSVADVFCAGEPTGIAGVEVALAEGELAGLAAAGEPPAPLAARRRRRGRGFAQRLARAFEPRAELRRLARPGTLVCRCEDVPFSGFHADWSARQAKLYTRAGMGACQGRVCGPALETLFGWASDSVRSPLKPACLETLEDRP